MSCGRSPQSSPAPEPVRTERPEVVFRLPPGQDIRDQTRRGGAEVQPLHGMPRGEDDVLDPGGTANDGKPVGGARTDPPPDLGHPTHVDASKRPDTGLEGGHRADPVHLHVETGELKGPEDGP